MMQLNKIIKRIEKEIKSIIKLKRNEKFWITHYGAIEIDPKYLVIWICVKTDEIKLKFEKDIELQNELYSLLAKYEYPKNKDDGVQIGFESQESVDRESEGNWWNHWR